jgi:hypothetical protein
MITDAGNKHKFMVKGLFYGAPGTGKTYSLTRLDGFRHLIIDVEGGRMSAKPDLPYADDVSDFMEIWNSPEKFPSAMVQIKSWEELTRTLKFFQQPKNRDQDRFQVISIDSLTECQKKLIDHLRTMDGNTTLLQDKTQILTVQGWQALGVQFEIVYRGFRNLNTHILFTALEEHIQDENSGILKWLPMFERKKTPFEIAGWMGIVGRTYTKNPITAKSDSDVSYRVRFRASPDNLCKCRGGALVDELLDLNPIFRILLGKEDKEEVTENVGNDTDKGQSVETQ